MKYENVWKLAVFIGELVYYLIRDSKHCFGKHINMCKPICWIFTWLLFYVGCVQIFSKCYEYLYLYYFDADNFEKSDFTPDGLLELEVLSLILAGTGPLLIYLQYKVGKIWKLKPTFVWHCQLQEKFLLCIWIIVFVLAEIEIFFLTLLDASRKWDRYSILHIHMGRHIYMKSSYIT